MSEERSNRRLPQKLTISIAGLWLLLALLTFVFVKIVFQLSPEQDTGFSWLFLIGAAFFGAVTIGVARAMLKPLLAFVVKVGAQEAISERETEKAARQARGYHFRIALISLLGPLLLMVLVAQVVGTHKIYFLVLGLFNSVFLSSILLLLSQKWLGGIQGVVAGCRDGTLGGHTVSLKLKLVLLGFALATVPTLLVGTMSFFTANRMLGNEMGRSMAGKLAKVNKQVSGLMVAGRSQDVVEHFLSQEAEKIGFDTPIHLGNAKGEFYRSEKAQARPSLYAQIFAHKLADPLGTLLEDETDILYAYAFSGDGRTVALAPIRSHRLADAVRALLLVIVGITLFSMIIATVVGVFFADNIGGPLKRMASVTSEVARGQLTREVRVLSDDEIGALGHSLHAMVNYLRRMVTNVSDLAGQIATTCEQLLVKSSAISTGAEIQARSFQETSGAVENMNGNIQSASDNLQSLAKSAQETTAAAEKVGESFNLMMSETMTLQGTIERTGDLVHTMVGSVTEVTGTIEDLSRGAERSAQSMAEIDRSISDVSANASETAQIARKAIDVAQEGAVAVRRTIEGMDRIVSSNRGASEVIVGLGNRIDEIGGILGVIGEIADQTNLLALNAAIIAAQAGEHGRGFAVVADEIRSLAERTGSSTREITEMINNIQETSEEAIRVMRGGGATVDEGVSLAQQAGDSLNQILISFQKAAENVEVIAGYTEGQARSSEQVTREISRVAEMAGRIAKVSIRQAGAGDDLQGAFQDTLKTSKSLSDLVNHQSQENRLAMAAISEMGDSTSRANKAMLGQSQVSDGILRAIEQVREIAKNHAEAALEMGEATKKLADKSAELKEEVSEFEL